MSLCSSTPIKSNLQQLISLFSMANTCCSPETSIASILKSKNKEVQSIPISLKKINNTYWNKLKLFLQAEKKRSFCCFLWCFLGIPLVRFLIYIPVWWRQYNKSHIYFWTTDVKLFYMKYHQSCKLNCDDLSHR